MTVKNLFPVDQAGGSILFFLPARILALSDWLWGQDAHILAHSASETNNLNWVHAYV